MDISTDITAEEFVSEQAPTQQAKRGRRRRYHWHGV